MNAKMKKFVDALAGGKQLHIFSKVLVEQVISEYVTIPANEIKAAIKEGVDVDDPVQLLRWITEQTDSEGKNRIKDDRPEEHQPYVAEEEVLKGSFIDVHFCEDGLDDDGIQPNVLHLTNYARFNMRLDASGAKKINVPKSKPVAPARKSKPVASKKR